MNTVEWISILLCSTNNLIQHQLIIGTVKCSTWSTDRALICSTTPGQSGPGGNSDEGVLLISQNSKIEATPSNSLVSYPGHSLMEVLALCRDATVVEDDQKAPFSIATTPRCRGGRYTFPWKVCDRSRGRPEGSLFNSYNTKM